ncbi:hypothetical protein JHD49_05985 [Sulfurimonas sp. SAG-AH-194-C21]|nr:hypothetical protein [Sulfurimonas sp. SAG-AH-194-C21]MDF1883488.1 hypothetical protein [Sulfurimonas sp. SAG-AH-194-C21]
MDNNSSDETFKINESWEKILNPSILKDNLISISLYIMTFELLKDKIETMVDDFYEVKYIGKDKKYKEEYEKSVLSLVSKKEKTHYITASLRWLISMNVLNVEDEKTYNILREYRNDLTHEFQNFLIDSNINFNVENMKLLADLFSRLEKQWIIEFEIPLNPDYDNKEIKIEETTSMQIIMLQLIYDIALNNEPEELYYSKFYESLNKKKMNFRKI